MIEESLVAGKVEPAVITAVMPEVTEEVTEEVIPEVDAPTVLPPTVPVEYPLVSLPAPRVASPVLVLLADSAGASYSGFDAKHALIDSASATIDPSRATCSRPLSHTSAIVAHDQLMSL